MRFMAVPALILVLLPMVCAQDNDVAAVRQDLMDAKIIPNIIPLFTPAFPLEVVFTDNAGSKFPVTAGANLTLSQTVNIPSFALKSNNTHIIGKSYLMAILDPDAPTPQNPNVSEVRHFLAADYVSSGLTNGQFVLKNQSKTATLTDYIGPAPPATSPPHRYVVLCYLQNTTGVTPPAGFNSTNRLNFNITSFVNSVHGNNFTLVGATFFFVSANDTAGSIASNSTTGNSSAASGTAPPGPSGSSTPNGAVQLSVVATAAAWSIVAVLSPILLL